MSGVLMTSCLDTIVLPVDKVIEEDFWQNRTDVSSMVNGAYAAMTSEAVMERMIVWGELRGDNVNPTANLSTTKAGIDEINMLNMDDKNTYTDWAGFYNVINRCNLVLAHAEEVMNNDPSYSKGNFNTDRSQMLALRALAHFYLVRAFRDVPYCNTAYQYSSQEMELPQLAPDSVLQLCINDLLEAEPIGLEPGGYSDWRGKGLVNKDAIRAILADVYLWRASMTGNAEDYRQCAYWCQKVIDSKTALVDATRLSFGTSSLLEDAPLYLYNQAFNQIFVGTGNSVESIFELQLNGGYVANTAVRGLYFQYRENQTPGFLVASQMMGKCGGKQDGLGTEEPFASRNDVRFWESCYAVDNADADAFYIRKMVTALNSRSKFEQKAYAVTGKERETVYARFAQNWILYRITDVMLMKAEALVQLAEDGATISADTNLKEAFDLVSLVYKRSLADEADVLQQNNYNSKDLMERLVLAERQRELCFEGKRWFDLVRYSYRHMDGVDAKTILAEQHKTITNSQGIAEANIAEFPEVYSHMITLLGRKYLENKDLLTYQLTTEPKLYFPINYEEMKVNLQLKQTPGYKSGNDYQKNY